MHLISRLLRHESSLRSRSSETVGNDNFANTRSIFKRKGFQNMTYNAALFANRALVRDTRSFMLLTFTFIIM